MRTIYCLTEDQLASQEILCCVESIKVTRKVEMIMAWFGESSVHRAVVFDFHDSSVHGTAVREVLSVTEVTNSVWRFYRIKLRAAVISSDTDTAHQVLQYSK
jgi:hypothetical protein